jgi:Acetyltransferase (GNAT) domain
LSKIRPFEPIDIPQVAALHLQAFGVVKSPDIDNRYKTYFTDKFIVPSQRGDLPSLVFEEENGEVAGFIGVATRHFVTGGRRIRAAVSTQFIVDPRARSRLIAVALLRNFLNGPQDLSFTDEANETSRRLWEKLGGSTSALYSLHWIAPLRPANLLLSKLRSRLGRVMTLAGPAASLIDGIIPKLPFRGKRASTHLEVEPLHAHALANLMSDFSDDVMLHPEYDAAPLGHLLDDAAQPKPDWDLQALLLRDRHRRVAGWYLYCLSRKRTAEVLQVGYRRGHQAETIDHLFNHARRGGAISIAGRLEPHMGKALASQDCLLYRRDYSMLIHSRDRGILDAIHSGKAFISRLDGEWCLRFH